MVFKKLFLYCPVNYLMKQENEIVFTIQKPIVT